MGQPHPMRVLETRVYRGAHRYSNVPMVRIQLELGALQERPTHTIAGFTSRLVDALPALAEHGCSVGRPGGFVLRLRDGTWLGHVAEHVALALQVMAGDRVSRGKTRSVPGSPGIYNVMFAYADEKRGRAAGRLALELVDRMLPPELRGIQGLDLVAPPLPHNVDDGPVAGLGAFLAMAERDAPAPTTASIVAAARERGIPVVRDAERRVIRLGTGSRQQLLQASVTARTSLLAAELARSKERTKRALASAGLPVPKGVVVSTADEVVAALAELRAPVVVKPSDGNHGRGVTMNVRDETDARRAFEAAAAVSPRVIVEQQLAGRDYRVLVVDGRVVAAAERAPARVIGDGASTIQQLIDLLNLDPRRGFGHGRVLSSVVLDDAAQRLLERDGLGPDSVPESGRVVQLRDAANLSAGGEAVDRTDELHPSIAAAAVRAAAVVGLDIAGIDLITGDLSHGWNEGTSGIVEVNAGPGFRMHVSPSSGTPRDVAGPVVDMLYPRGQRATIPVVAVTGSNGKTTVVRMIAQLAAQSGATVGMTTTNGIEVGGHLVGRFDASGPKSARRVLADPTVDIAVLETARGGIVREGVGYDRADVGVVLNVTGDHLGLGGVTTLEELAEVKSVVARAVRPDGTTVLGADDPLALGMAGLAPGRVALFSSRRLDDAPPELAALVASGGCAATVEPVAGQPWLVLHEGGAQRPVLPVASIPASFGGAIEFVVLNALAASLAAFALGIPPERIATGLAAFESNFDQNPGRFNVTTAPGFTTIVDYGHNPPALRALGRALAALRPTHERFIGVVSTPGDRRDEDVRELGAVAAEIFDELVFRERADGRGREAGGVIALLTEGALSAGMQRERIRQITAEHEAVDAALSSAGPRDLVVLMPTDVARVWRQATGFRAAWITQVRS